MKQQKLPLMCAAIGLVLVAAGSCTPFFNTDYTLAPQDLGDLCGEDSDCRTNYCDPDLGICLDEGFVLVEAGEYTIGASEGDTLALENESPPHTVRITRSFEMMSTEATEALWQEVMGTADTPSRLSFCREQCPDSDPYCCPLESMNFWETLRFLNLMSASYGLQECYTLEGECADTLGGRISLECASGAGNLECPSDFVCNDTPAVFALRQDCTGFRLPTEAEWEFAARARGATQTSTGDGNLTVNGERDAPQLSDEGWYVGTTANVMESDAEYRAGAPCTCLADTEQGRPALGNFAAACGTGVESYALDADGWDQPVYRCTAQPVGQLEANPLGLYDMLGNVSEWVWDRAFEYEDALAIDPLGPTSVGETRRIVRGGSWRSDASRLRYSSRQNLEMDIKDTAVGFRPVRTMPSE